VSTPHATADRSVARRCADLTSTHSRRSGRCGIIRQHVMLRSM
jgi:hypothetical protein